MGTEILQKNSEDQGLGIKADTSLSAVLLVGSFEVTQGCLRFPDPGYIGKFFASSYCPCGPDVFSVICNPCSGLHRSDFGTNDQRTGSLRIIERTSAVNRGLIHDF